MKLTELFPDLPKIKIGGIQYEVKFGTRAMLQLEKEYPDKIENENEITTQQQALRVMSSAMTGIKTSDLISMLFAGLIHTEAFANKDILIDATEPKDFSVYADAIVSAFMKSSMTDEQLEKLQVMAADSGSKKKQESEITPLTTPFIESSAE